LNGFLNKGFSNKGFSNKKKARLLQLPGGPLHPEGRLGGVVHRRVLVLHALQLSNRNPFVGESRFADFTKSSRISRLFAKIEGVS